MLTLKVDNTYKSTAPTETADILLIDTENNNTTCKLATTNTWNIQQGSMVQWLGPEYAKEIIFNDFRDGNYCSVILDVNTGEERIISKPVYSVSNDGQFGLTLDFSRLHRLRKGYGYSNKEELTKDHKVPESTSIWKVDLQNNEITPILTYKDFYNFENNQTMIGAEHKVNHIMLNPSGNRFMVLHRWMKNDVKYTRLVTANVDGSDMYNLNDDNMTSHCFWKNDTEIIAYANRNDSGVGYFHFVDQTSQVKPVLESLNKDGHPSYSPNGEYILTDTYPNKERMASIYIAHRGNIQEIAKVFAPFKYDNELRCDLHPRWNRDGTKISFDSVFEGKRRQYVININEATLEDNNE